MQVGGENERRRKRESNGRRRRPVASVAQSPRSDSGRSIDFAVTVSSSQIRIAGYIFIRCLDFFPPSIAFLKGI